MGEHLTLGLALVTVEDVLRRVARRAFVAEAVHQVERRNDVLLQVGHRHVRHRHARRQDRAVVEHGEAALGHLVLVLRHEEEHGSAVAGVDEAADRAVPLHLRRVNLVAEAADAMELGVRAAAVGEQDECLRHRLVGAGLAVEEPLGILVVARVLGNDVVGHRAVELLDEAVDDANHRQPVPDENVVGLHLLDEAFPVVPRRLGRCRLLDRLADGGGVPAVLGGLLRVLDLAEKVADRKLLVGGDDLLPRLGGGDPAGEIKLPEACGAEAPVDVVLPEPDADAFPDVLRDQAVGLIRELLALANRGGNLLVHHRLPLAALVHGAEHRRGVDEGFAGIDEAVVRGFRPFELLLGTLEIEVRAVVIIGLVGRFAVEEGLAQGAVERVDPVVFTQPDVGAAQPCGLRQALAGRGSGKAGFG